MPLKKLAAKVNYSLLPASADYKVNPFFSAHSWLTVGRTERQNMITQMTLMQIIKAQTEILSWMMKLGAKESLMFKGATRKPDYRFKF